MNFDKDSTENVPHASGIYVMHTAMKILYVGYSYDMRKSLGENRSDPCISEAKRFRYMLTNSPDEAKKKLLKEYFEKHGQLPRCNHKEEL
ncbi:MAG: hypothetical protein ACE5KO_05580 [Candidatus Bathyarchaeia archaeon]